MKTLRILIAAGLTPEKFKKVSSELESLLAKENVQAKISTVNIYDQKDLTSFEADNDLVLAVGGQNLTVNLPVINGMGLVYGWMDRNKMIQDILQTISN